MSKKIKSPKELYESKRLDLLERLQSQKIIEEEILKEKENNKKILSPKILFNDPVVERKKKVVEEYIVEELQEEKIEDIVYNLSSDINQIRENIVSKRKYNAEIENLKNYIDTFKEDKFDATYIYKNLFVLREEIESIRSEIPEIPEPILYDEDLNQLRNVIVEVKNSIPVVPEIKYYDQELDDLLQAIETIKGQIENLPEVKYYDQQITEIEQRISEVNSSIPVIPEIKYYDEDIVQLQEKIDQVNSNIPTIPEFPEVRYYEDQINDLENKIDGLKESINLLPEPKYYDQELDLISQKIDEVKNSIPEPQVLPEVKYYDNDIKTLKNDFDSLSKKVSIAKKTDKKELEKLYENYQKSNALLNDKIKHLEEIFEHFNESQKEYLQEEITEPPKTDNKDPLTPLDQNFVTFKQLQEHYRTFINRIQQQLSTLGGGGETQLKYLDDVTGIATNPSAYDGKFLKYDHTSRKFVFETVVSGGGGGADLDAFSVTVDSPGTANLSYNNTNGVFTYTPPNLVGYATEGYVDNLVSISTFSGDYNDLTNKPVGLSSFSNDVGFVTSSIVVGYATEGYVDNLVSISTFSGDYGDLTNAPTVLSAFVDDVGYMTIAGGSMNLSDILGIGTAVTQLSTVSTSTIDSFLITTYRSARYQVQISQGTDYQCTDLLLIHNDSTASLIESGSVATNNYLATFSTTISGSNLLLQVDMANSASATIKVVRYSVTV